MPCCSVSPLLLVGAVGVATMMTTTVRERSAEIGLLRAIGASQRQIPGLFLGEVVLISLLGGVIGRALHSFLLVLVLLASAFIGL